MRSKPLPAPNSLAALLPGRDNHLNLIRMVAASAVLVSHAYPIMLGPQAVEPLVAMTGQSLGHYAVAVFFGLSGLLIARSFDRRKSLFAFAMARVLRLFPALAVVLLVTMLAGALVTTMGPASYFGHPDTWTYVPRNLSLAFLQYSLPGVFTDNVYGPSINGSLWTLFYEVVCYGSVVAFGLIGLLRRPILFSVAFCAIAVAHLASLGWEPTGGMAYRIDRLALLGFPFAMGMLAYVWRDRLILHPGMALTLWVLTLAVAQTSYLPSAIMVALIYSTLCLGFMAKGPALAYNRIGDFSYGTYIYAFPIQQTLSWLAPEMSPLANIAIGLPVTIVCAAASWHLVEKRSLAWAQRLGSPSREAVPAGV